MTVSVVRAVKRLGLVESFAVADERGNLGNVERHLVGASGGPGRARPLTLYYLASGELVNRVSTKEFIVAATGARWCRVSD